MQAHSRCTCLSDIQHGWLQTLGQLQVVHPSWAGPRCWLVTPQPPLHMLALRYRPFFAMEPGSMENLSIPIETTRKAPIYASSSSLYPLTDPGVSPRGPVWRGCPVFQEL